LAFALVFVLVLGLAVFSLVAILVPFIYLHFWAELDPARICSPTELFK
jgi:hypothetical protein